MLYYKLLFNRCLENISETFVHKIDCYKSTYYYYKQWLYQFL
jgi:ACT domain-containing protein